jgi:hypothetical protein
MLHYDIIFWLHDIICTFHMKCTYDIIVLWYTTRLWYHSYGTWYHLCTYDIMFMISLYIYHIWYHGMAIMNDIIYYFSISAAGANSYRSTLAVFTLCVKNLTSCSPSPSTFMSWTSILSITASMSQFCMLWSTSAGLKIRWSDCATHPESDPRQPLHSSSSVTVLKILKQALARVNTQRSSAFRGGISPAWKSECTYII